MQSQKKTSTKPAPFYEVDRWQGIRTEIPKHEGAASGISGSCWSREISVAECADKCPVSWRGRPAVYQPVTCSIHRRPGMGCRALVSPQRDVTRRSTIDAEVYLHDYSGFGVPVDPDVAPGHSRGGPRASLSFRDDGVSMCASTCVPDLGSELDGLQLFPKTSHFRCQRSALHFGQLTLTSETADVRLDSLNPSDFPIRITSRRACSLTHWRDNSPIKRTLGGGT